jgi:hypothetical protein
MNKPADILHIPDTQSEPDARRLAIQRVGVKDLRYPRAQVARGPPPADMRNTINRVTRTGLSRFPVSDAEFIRRAQ